MIDQPCVGRDLVVRELLERAAQLKCVLLYGGRQAGKTTLLRNVERVSVAAARGAVAFADAEVAVYVDLMGLPYDAEPSDFYRLLVLRTGAVLARVEEPRGPREKPRLRYDVEAFVAAVAGMLEAHPQLKRITFLLDEGSRVLGSRFPRAFQDNLFGILYGGDRSPASDSLAFVFSGAQELLRFCEDSTSPLGSRAGEIVLRNLDRESVRELVYGRCPELDREVGLEVTSYIFSESGGHAGLASRMADAASAVAHNTSQSGLVEAVKRTSHGRLFDHWVLRLSGGARAVADKVVAGTEGGWSRRRIARTVRAAGLDPFLGMLVWNELQYVGVCTLQEDGEVLVPVNQLFWRHYQSVAVDIASEGSSDLETETWALIRKVEVAMRALVVREFTKRWGAGAHSRMRRILGEDAWGKIEGIRLKAAAKYGGSPQYRRTLMDCMYLGQLGTLLESNQSWQLFRGWLGDKSVMQRWVREISVVRNDLAHFVLDLPEKELRRCHIACDDLLVILQQALGEDETVGLR